eukprot:CAMPEP_0184871582 /NCGR_PEP_ID=MMETSP0580-20130426/40802_1 /TAXON_ID=1118495 /ORGANISM="Dactyliosolen fragilissimus" /LENGTH=1122 /DNA_ID=CAMNT_0027374259 /DNA_START=125 /DNA_END=3490 /DNA_ORIENTATION=-
MNCITYLLFYLIASPFARAFHDGKKRIEDDSQQVQGRSLRKRASFKITCTVYLYDYFPLSILEGGDEDIPSTYSCVDHGNEDKEYKLLYAGNSNEDAIVSFPLFGGEAPLSGETKIRVSTKSVVDDFSIDLSIKSNRVKLLRGGDNDRSPSMKRRLRAKRIGESTVAVFRINSADDQPTKSAAELTDDIFGLGIVSKDVYNLVSGYQFCSGNKLNFKIGKGNGLVNKDVYNLVSGYQFCSGNKLNFKIGEGNGLVNGVREIYLDQATAGIDKDTVDRWVWDKLGSNGINFPLNSYDHYIYVMPGNVNFEGAAAYACLWCPKSVYFDIQASNYQVLLHEVGHNIGHVHSGKDGASYGDRTCWMGAHTYWDEGPKACFNAPKSWYMGWYADRHIQVEPSTEPVTLKLAGIDDYLNDKTTEGEHHVILRLKEGGEDLYILYNRAKGVNSGVRGSVDLVTVVEQRGGDRRQSWQLAELDAGETFTKSNWDGSGQNLIVSVCNTVPGKGADPDIANIVAYVDDGTSPVSCDGFTFAPTNSPTNSPTRLHVSYYAVSLSSLPDEGLGSLTPYYTEYVGNINFNAGSGSFAGSGRSNDVAALFEGYLKFPVQKDSYYLCLTSDDGSKLFIDDELVIDNDVSGRTKKCGVYDATEDISRVEVEYFERSGGSVLVFEWVPLSRPPQHRLMEVVSSYAFVNKPGNPTNSPTKEPTVPSPTLEPSPFPSSNPSTSSPTFQSSGNVHVKYYSVSLDTLPLDGLKSLTSYSEGYVENIDFELTSSGFATSGKDANVAALFEGYLDFPITDTYYICLTSDDGSKLFIQDSLVIDNDGLHGSEQECSLYDTSAGPKEIAVEYFQRGGGAVLNLQFVPLSRPPDFRLMRIVNPSEFVSKPGVITEMPSTSPTLEPSPFPSTSTPTFQSSGNVHVKYYSVSLDTLPLDGLKSLTSYSEGYVENIDFELTSSGFATSGKDANVAALFEGYLDFPITDTYYICLTSDDGSKLFIQDSLVIDNDGLHGSEQECSLYDTSAGPKEIAVEYFQRGGGAVLNLQFVPLSRPPDFRLMRIVNPSEFVSKPGVITEMPSTSPTLEPSPFPSTSTPTFQSSGNVHVKYYSVILDTLPLDGLKSLTSYS